MDFLGIGLPELVGILLIVFLVMGPQDLVKIGATLGRAMRKLRMSDTWRAVQDAGRQLRELPETLAREAGIDELKETQAELREELNEQKQALEEDIDRQISAWTRKPDPLSQNKKPNQHADQPTKPSSEGN